jgi:hypothetical protein
MRGIVQCGAVLALGAVLTACSATKTAYVPTGKASASPSASASAQASPGTAAAGTGPLGVLPIPAGTQPWTSNTNKLMNADAFIKAFYAKSAWTEEETLLPRRGFVSGVVEGWINADGSQQMIAIYRFATANGAVSEFDAIAGTLRGKPKPATMLTDPADGGVGTVSPTLDSLGNAVAEIAARSGDYVIDVHEFSAASPDPAAAKALLLKQYDSLKRG